MLINCKLYHVTLTRFHVIRFELTIKKKIMFHITYNNMNTQQPIVLIKMVFLGKSMQQQTWHWIEGQDLNVLTKYWSYVIGFFLFIHIIPLKFFCHTYKLFQRNIYICRKIYTNYCLSKFGRLIWSDSTFKLIRM